MRSYLTRTLALTAAVLALTAAVLSLITGCAQQTGSLTKARASFLVFVGDTTSAKVTINDRAFDLTKNNAKNYFEVAPGVHRVKVEKRGQVVVDREILLSDHQTMEVSIP